MTPTTRLDRRRFLRGAFASCAIAGLAARTRGARVLQAASAQNGKKLLVIFLRGGNDAINSIIPAHDPQYYALRPTLAIAPQQQLDLGNGAATFHPALAKLKEVHDLGRLASIQRVGYPHPTLSHFAGQQYVETAKPGDNDLTEGWVARWAEQAGATDPLCAISVSRQLQMAFTGERVLAHVPNVAQYSLGASAASAKLWGTSSSGLLALFGAPPGSAPYDPLVHETGDMLGATMDALEGLPSYAPTPGAFPITFNELLAEGLPPVDYGIEFFRSLRDAVHLLKHTAASIVGVEMEGFDHHGGQGALAGPHADRLALLAHGMRSVMRETQLDAWNDLVVMVESEFGRTSAENGSGGTDHGEAGAMWVAGGNVLGGVHHCDPQSWPAGSTLESSGGRYVKYAVDFRAVLAEVLERHLGLDAAQIDTVVPNWSKASGATTAPLGLIL